jgi:hypothetical protein
MGQKRERKRKEEGSTKQARITTNVRIVRTKEKK